jgi:hypothetical protein
MSLLGNEVQVEIDARMMLNIFSPICPSAQGKVAECCRIGRTEDGYHKYMLHGAFQLSEVHMELLQQGLS